MNQNVSTGSLNIAARMTEMARELADETAIVEPARRRDRANSKYRSVSFRELDEDSSRLAAGLRRQGAGPGTRIALLVRPGIDFVSLVFALFKTGSVAILIDPGMGLRGMVGCLAEAEPEGFVAIPAAHVIRTVLRSRFRHATINVTVGRRLGWGGTTIDQLRAESSGDTECVRVDANDPAAIIFTSGSTGPAKGVLYSHANFAAQVDQIRDRFDIQPREVEVACFPLFALFNCAMGVTAVIPEMDASHPARVDPNKIVEAIQDWRATQAFGSPAVWARVGPHCQQQGIRLPTLRRVLSAGAPVPTAVLDSVKSCIHPDGDVQTPYGATEALPVATISATEVLGDTADASRRGAGTCVGRRFSQVEWKVIRITEGPVAQIGAVEELPQGEIGELIVRGPQVTRAYVTRVEANARAKIVDGDTFWHRMGDVGYLDAQDRFWYCGRMAHRVETAAGPLYSIRCEAIFNAHPRVARSALVGIGPAGRQKPVIVVEPHDARLPNGQSETTSFVAELRALAGANSLTEPIEEFLFHRSFPVDVRHNSKIFREKLAEWAVRKLGA